VTRPRRILLVDDDESIRQFIEMALSDEGYEVVTAENGQAALDILGRWTPSLILLDMRMPIMDGWAFSCAFRQAPNEEKVPVVVLTAARDAAESAAEIGADAVLSKPFDLGELIALVRKHARR
jgi:two-component system chemotaxis response regulator CheY